MKVSIFPEMLGSFEITVISGHDIRLLVGKRKWCKYANGLKRSGNWENHTSNGVCWKETEDLREMFQIVSEYFSLEKTWLRTFSKGE